MPKTFITELQPNREVTSIFILAEKSLRQAKNGNPFLTLKLVDRTGQIPARIWDNATQIDAELAVNIPVRVRGRCESFRDELQIQVQEIVPVAIEDIDAGDFLPVCPIDTDQLMERLKQALGRIKRDSLRKLCRAFLSDKALMARFRKAPAAKGVHHAYLGGLLEHTASLAQLAVEIAKHYPSLDADMLIMGAFLHDIGKIDEFVYDLSIDYSDSGRLLGHMILGVRILEDKVAALKGFPEEDALLLTHMVLSHHGEAEFGAAKVPMTKEAFVLHILDDLDAKIDSLERVIGKAAPGVAPWTSFQPLYERYFYRGTARMLDGEPETADCREEAGEGCKQLGLWGAAMNPGKQRQ